MIKGAYIEFMRTHVELPLMEENKEMNTKTRAIIYHIMQWLKRWILKGKGSV